MQSFINVDGFIFTLLVQYIYIFFVAISNPWNVVWLIWSLFICTWFYVFVLFCKKKNSIVPIGDRFLISHLLVTWLCWWILCCFILQTFSRSCRRIWSTAPLWLMTLMLQWSGSCPLQFWTSECMLSCKLLGSVPLCLWASCKNSHIVWNLIFKYTSCAFWFIVLTANSIFFCWIIMILFLVSMF